MHAYRFIQMPYCVPCVWFYWNPCSPTGHPLGAVTQHESRWPTRGIRVFSLPLIHPPRIVAVVVAICPFVCGTLLPALEAVGWRSLNCNGCAFNFHCRIRLEGIQTELDAPLQFKVICTLVLSCCPSPFSPNIHFFMYVSTKGVYHPMNCNSLRIYKKKKKS